MLLRSAVCCLVVVLASPCLHAQPATAPFVEATKLQAVAGAAGDELGAVAIAGDILAIGSWLADVGPNAEQGVVYVFQRSAGGSWAGAIQVAVLTASNGAVDDQLGWTTAISGDTIVAGARLADVGGDVDQGAVYVFERPAGGWVDATETAVLTAANGGAGDRFGWPVSIDGDTVVVGAPRADPGGQVDRGAAYLFEKPAAGAWANATETAVLAAANGAAGDEFGQAVGVCGDAVVIGAPRADLGGQLDQGAAYVFARPVGGWVNATETGVLTASDGVGGDCLGITAAIRGDTVAVGAWADGTTPGFLEQGAAYVFVEPVGGWTNAVETARLEASDGQAFDFFGAAVAVAADFVAVGSPLADVGLEFDQGAVYVFEKPAGSGWIDATEDVVLTASDGAAGDRFGITVTLGPGGLGVGAPFADINGAGNQGAAWVFDLQGYCTCRNGGGINPVEFDCITRPVLGATWVSQIATDAITVSTLLGFGFFPHPGFPLLGGEILIELAPPAVLLPGLGQYQVPIPGDAVFLGLRLHCQGFRIEQPAGGGPLVLVILNALDLRLGR